MLNLLQFPEESVVYDSIATSACFYTHYCFLQNTVRPDPGAEET